MFESGGVEYYVGPCGRAISWGGGGVLPFFNSVCRRSSRIRVAFFVLEDEEEVVGIKSSQTKPNFCTLLLLLLGGDFFPFFVVVF